MSIPIIQSITFLISLALVILGAIIMVYAKKAATTNVTATTAPTAIYRCGTGILVIGVIFLALASADLYYVSQTGLVTGAIGSAAVGSVIGGNSKLILASVSALTSVTIVILSSIIISQVKNLTATDSNAIAINRCAMICLGVSVAGTAASGFNLYTIWQSTRGVKENATSGHSPKHHSPKHHSPKYSPRKIGYTF